MSLQALYAVLTAHPGRCLNVLAMFFACAGAWLLLATRQRELRAEAQVDGLNDGHGEAVLDAEPTLRLNRFFYQFGFACLVIALVLSWDSTRL